MWSSDIAEDWINAPVVVNYVLEVMLDVEGALQCLSMPVLNSGRLMGLFLKPSWEMATASFINLICLTVGCAVLYFLFTSGFVWAFWIAAAGLAFLF